MQQFDMTIDEFISSGIAIFVGYVYPDDGESYYINSNPSEWTERVILTDGTLYAIIN